MGEQARHRHREHHRCKELSQVHAQPSSTTQGKVSKRESWWKTGLEREGANITHPLWLWKGVRISPTGVRRSHCRVLRQGDPAVSSGLGARSGKRQEDKTLQCSSSCCL